MGPMRRSLAGRTGQVFRRRPLYRLRNRGLDRVTLRIAACRDQPLNQTWRPEMHSLKVLALATVASFTLWSVAQAQDAGMQNHAMAATMPDACIKGTPPAGHAMGDSSSMGS